MWTSLSGAGAPAAGLGTAVPLRRISVIWPDAGVLPGLPFTDRPQKAVSAPCASATLAGAVRSLPKLITSAEAAAGSASVMAAAIAAWRSVFEIIYPSGIGNVGGAPAVRAQRP